MTERPIIFSAPMVRAILAGTKTQTRRLVTRATSEASSPWDRLDFAGRNRDMRAFPDGQVTQYLHVPLAPHANDPQDDPDHWAMARVFPRVSAGDTLWVRETIRCAATWNDGRDDRADAVYCADDAPTELDGWPWKRFVLPSIHCPRGLSRISLRVTCVRVERLQAIEPEDAIAEGMDSDNHPRAAFHLLWDKLNAKRAPWSSNPWVWVVAFERL